MTGLTIAFAVTHDMTGLLRSGLLVRLRPCYRRANPAPRRNSMIPSTGRPLIRFSVKWDMVEEPLSILEKFRLLKDLGFDGVELDAPNELPLAELLNARDRTGLAIPGVVNSRHWTLPLTDPDPAIRAAGIEAAITALDDARRYGADTLLLVPGRVNAQTSYAQAYERAVTEIRKLIPHMEQTGIRIAFENVWNDFLLSPLEAARFVDEFAHSMFGWYFDTGNVLRYGRPIHWIEALGHRIFRIDAKEYSLERMNAEGLWKGFEVELGEGDCDWPALNKALAAVGYSGWASGEVKGGDRHRLATIRSQLERIASA